MYMPPKEVIVRNSVHSNNLLGDETFLLPLLDLMQHDPKVMVESLAKSSWSFQVPLPPKIITRPREKSFKANCIDSLDSKRAIAGTHIDVKHAMVYIALGVPSPKRVRYGVQQTLESRC